MNYDLRDHVFFVRVHLNLKISEFNSRETEIPKLVNYKPSFQFSIKIRQ